MAAVPWHERYIPEPNSGCWIWEGDMHQDGYGACYVPETRNTRPAHRKFYELHVGPIENGLLALHRCDNRLCVNPDHIFLGTQADNMADKVRKGRSLYGDRNPRAKLTALQVAAIRASTKTQAALGKEYGVTQAQISNIKTGKQW